MRFFFLTNDFPNPYQPTKGLFNLSLARALGREHNVQVVSPIPWVDEWQAWTKKVGSLGPERVAILDGIKAHYPRYYYPPRILRHRYGFCYWSCIRSTVWGLINERLPDAILSYWAYPDGDAAIRLARMIGVPAAVIIGGSDVLMLPKAQRWRRCVLRVLRDADAVLAVSRDLRSKIIDLGASPEKVHTWSQGVDTDRFRPGDRAEARRRLGIPAEGKVLLWVGRMHPVKALDVLLAACARLRDRGAGFRLYLVGDGPLRNSLEADSRSRGLSEVVRFVGSQLHTQLPDWYRAADVTVLPSWSEGLPNVLRESLASGTPFVASNVGGIPEIAQGAPDCLVPPGDPDALAGALARALDRPPACPPSRSLSWARSAEALLDIIRPLVAAAQDQDRPWWSGREPSDLRADTPVSPLRWRQLLRRGIAGLVPRRLFLVRGPADGGRVSLTFDDGPHPVYTPRLLDLLKRRGVTVTFFLVGRMAEQHPDLVRRMAAEGHAVGNHSFLHPNLAELSLREALGNTLRTQEVLARILGTPPTLYRPPRGKVSALKLLSLWKAGLTVTLWNVDPRDYSCQSAEGMRTWFREHPLRGGDIVLLHDRVPHALDVLPELIETTQARGLTFTPVSAWTN
jgi:glycosyltransferase involved in cell wall biosynthesis/peptidoglycan/xylan/chitin deacetylase (PgdA/CDA1 family)